MLILASETDVAAVNIRDRLLTLWNPVEIGESAGPPVHRSPGGRTTLATIPTSALMLDNPHLTLFGPGTPPPDIILYLSRHQSVSGTRTLTVHPVGNFGEAAFGGRERTLVPTAPRIMTHALRLLASHPVPGYEITFEATHHGPWNEAPTFFIEIGSTPEEWNDPVAIAAVAETVHELILHYESGGIPAASSPGTVCIGLGGGHYAPRHTRVALTEGFDFGHILPGYARKELDSALAEEIIARTPGVNMVCAHGKKHRKEGQVFREFGLEYAEF